jgi:ribonuclease HI
MSNQKDASKRTMIAVVSDSKGKILSDVSNHGGSNNIAELMAMEHALDIALKMKLKKLHIISDSRCAISQFKKDESKRNAKSIRKMNDYEWYQAIKGRIDRLKQYIDVTLEWQGRDSNLAGHYIENKYGL